MGWKDTIKKDKSLDAPTWKDTIENEAPSAEYPDGTLETMSDMVVSAPQGITSWADEIQAGVQALGTYPELANPAAFEGMPQEEGKPFLERVEDEAIPIRERLALARKRSPWASAGTEVGTGIATSFVPLLGAGKAASLGGAAVRGAVEGLGTSNDKLSTEGAINTGIGAAFGAGGNLLAKGIGKLVTASPNKLRASAMGAGATQFKETGIKSREKIAKSLNETGLFHPTKVDYDVATGKFVPLKKSLDNLEPAGKEKYLTRLEEASEKIDDAKKELLAKIGPVPIDIDEVEEELAKAAKEYAKEGTGFKKRLQDANTLLRNIIDDIMEHTDDSLQTPTIADLEAAKKRIGKDVGKYGRNPLLAETPDTQELFQTYYRKVNEYLRKVVGDNKYSQYNDTQQKMLTVQGDLLGAIAAESGIARSGSLPRNYAQRFLDKTIMSDDMKLMAASAKEGMDKLKITPALKYGAIPLAGEAGFEGIRQLDPSIPQYIQRPEEQSNAPAGFERPKPLPSSVYKMFPNLAPKSTMITPRQMIDYKIPRSTQGILDNKEMVIGKLQQNNVPDELVATIAQALDNDHEAVANIAPLVIQQFPNIFERSKYQVFDGIIAPTDRAKAADAISKREDMNSIQRAKAIDGINKSGKFPQELA